MKLDELKRLAQAATPGPYFVALDVAEECGPHANSGLSLVDTGRQEDWPIARLCETQSAALIAALSPERVLRMLAVIEAAKAMRELCRHANRGSWDNGVTDSTGTIQEGEYIATGVFDDFDAALAALEEAP